MSNVPFSRLEIHRLNVKKVFQETLRLSFGFQMNKASNHCPAYLAKVE